MIQLATLGCVISAAEVSLIATYIFYEGRDQTPTPVLFCWSVVTAAVWLAFFVVAAFKAANSQSNADA